jgi:hypothetical protein
MLSQEPATHGRNVKRLFLPMAHTFAFAAYPVARVVAANVLDYPIDIEIVLRALMVVIAVTAAVLWLLGLLGWTLGARASWLSVVLLVWNFYPFLPPLLGFGPRVILGTTWVAAAYVIAAIALASVLIRPWRSNMCRDPLLLTIVAGLLLTINLLPIARAVATPTTRWESSVRRLTSPSLAVGSPAPKRDIYLIVLDGFVRPDILRDRFGVDLTEFVNSLNDAGFYVPARSRSNYSQTFLALSSMLNMSYLDEIASAMGENSRDRRPLKALIENNALMASAKQAGYTVVAIGSDYTATDSFPLADVCVCGYRDPHEIEFGALRLGPGADLGLDYWIAGARQRRVIDTFGALERTRTMAGPKLVVVHVLVPHPPFVFDRHGRPRVPPRGSVFIEGEWLPRAVRSHPNFRKEYAEGYAEQARFVADRIIEVIRSLSADSSPVPAMMIVGDHGSGLELDVFDANRTDITERMSVFSAYRLPDSEGASLYPDISPINGARALANRYFGVYLSFLPERSLFSIWGRPYSFLPVSPEHAGSPASMRLD